MTHLFGIPINGHKVLWQALAEIPGIGKKTALNICKNVGILPTAYWKDLQEKDKAWLRSWMRSNIEEVRPLGTEFLRQRRLQRKAMISLGSYRGIRRRLGLPARGQNTHSNAKTARKIKI